MITNPFAALLLHAELSARSLGGRAVPDHDPRGGPSERPHYPRLVKLTPGSNRRERRAAASPRLRPEPTTPAARAWLARHRAQVAQARCAAREARRG